MHPPGLLLYLTVDDVSESLAVAESTGGSAVVPPWSLPGLGAMAVAADPEGNRVGLWTPSPV